MTRILAVVLVAFTLLMNSCAEIQSKEAPLTCASTDLGTTVLAVSSGLGVEKNPLLAPSVNAHHFFPLALVKLLPVALIWWAWDWIEQHDSIHDGIAAASVITCGVAAHNALVLLK